ncbi:hypothetical protein CLOSTASPAR_03128 [[Clostridium] asparagiforme DSM 15981]|uniref:Uncharacterized protein n=1 Tax=[Clostridium] asparagiforme DSM 15981 TaxID=518636 RepID=C0D1J0_9FIRM|nr:hypothetical protein CLOSTASPAR_03128 [[Clostridium] asparagiforme DSM 15981]
MNFAKPPLLDKIGSGGFVNIFPMHMDKYFCSCYNDYIRNLAEEGRTYESDIECRICVPPVYERWHFHGGL